MSVSYAWHAVEQTMALVPEGTVMLRQRQVSDRSDFDSYTNVNPTPVDAFYLDKTPVTNADYMRFVEAGCYASAELWPEAILPLVLQFTDRTKQPGPRHWTGGQPDKDKRDHPVVGVCWYEASAYAKWVGKQLPTPAQWQLRRHLDRQQRQLRRDPLPLGQLVRSQQSQCLGQRPSRYGFRHGV